ncbi:hypothetical protein [Stutzerimonas stutzeri]|uniref:hypothetical protein n=1 Tax=Stutzerimonas stutzeri TaxID=316 RepID=UPI0015E33FF7|nr:hypothetical protein [Stutzerimonas stutzeri]MBA1263302.1 hypothetical protein [Stutzerimonas stutzeri]
MRMIDAFPDQWCGEYSLPVCAKSTGAGGRGAFLVISAAIAIKKSELYVSRWNPATRGAAEGIADQPAEHRTDHRVELTDNTDSADEQ